MNRVIKFRAWAKDAKIFLTELYINFDGVLYYNSSIGIKKCTEDNYVLNQFTGLLDKNGKEIWEGDRLKDSSGYIWVVYWYADHACFGCYDESLPHIKHEIIDNLNFKVIGNVFENPELIK